MRELHEALIIQLWAATVQICREYGVDPASLVAKPLEVAHSPFLPKTALEKKLTDICAYMMCDWSD